ncbi:MAG TPA: PA2169 family four-helix-bundle protein [Anaerolineae bacterium]
MANDDLKQVVDDLLEKLEANKEFYDTAANNAVHPQLKELLQERAQRRAKFAAELESWEGEKADVEGDGLEAVQRGLMTIKAAMTIERDKTDDVVLTDTQEADARILESYRQVLTEDLPAGLRGLIKRQYEQIHAAYAYVGTRLEEGDQPIVIGLFANVADARQAVNALELAGFDRQQIGVLAQDETVRETLGDDTQQSARETAGAAALGGGIIGGLIGLAAGLTIPIVFPVLAAGTIAAALGVAAAGAGIGASYGGIFGALIGWGVAEDETHRYVESVRRGEILIAVHADPERTEEAARILRQAGGHSIATRYEAPEEA